MGLIVTAANTTVRFDAEYIVPFELAPDWCSVLRPEAIEGYWMMYWYLISLLYSMILSSKLKNNHFHERRTTLF